MKSCWFHDFYTSYGTSSKRNLSKSVRSSTLLFRQELSVGIDNDFVMCLAHEFLGRYPSTGAVRYWQLSKRKNGLPICQPVNFVESVIFFVHHRKYFWFKRGNIYCTISSCHDSRPSQKAGLWPSDQNVGINQEIQARTLMSSCRPSCVTWNWRNFLCVSWKTPEKNQQIIP